MFERKNFYNKKLQLIGWWKRGVYRKVVSKKKHLLKIMDAWGVEKYVIDDLKSKYECEEIRIKDIDEEIVYVISLKDFLEHATERNFETPQMFVSRKYFKKLDANTWKNLSQEFDSSPSSVSAS